VQITCSVFAFNELSVVVVVVVADDDADENKQQIRTPIKSGCGNDIMLHRSMPKTRTGLPL